MKARRIVFLLFLGVQLLDGVFTYVAASALGPQAEANVLLATWMAAVGPGPTLVVAKSVAATAGMLIYVIGLHAVLGVLTAIYACFSIAPWLHVYLTWP